MLRKIRIVEKKNITQRKKKTKLEERKKNKKAFRTFSILSFSLPKEEKGILFVSFLNSFLFFTLQNNKKLTTSCILKTTWTECKEEKKERKENRKENKEKKKKEPKKQLFRSEKKKLTTSSILKTTWTICKFSIWTNSTILTDCIFT